MQDIQIIKGYLIPGFDSQILDINYLNEHYNELDISSFGINSSINMTFGGTKKEIIFCDKENPVVLTNNSNMPHQLVIYKEYYDEHKKDIDDLIIKIVKNKKNSSFTFQDWEIINTSLLKAILDNPEITEITLGTSSSSFKLTKEIYEMFKNTHVKKIITNEIDDDLKENFDSLIGYNSQKNLIASYKYESLSSNKTIILDKKLTKDELENFKYLSKEAEVIIKSNDYENYIEVIKRYLSLNKDLNVTFRVSNKPQFNKYLFKFVSESDNLERLSNLNVNVEGEKYNLLTYLNFEKRLTEMIIPALNLSPLEKYLFAYNIVKKYKKYKENEEDKGAARNVYQLLDNEYMVCAGFSSLLKDLLNKLGIESIDFSVTVDVGLDYIKDDMEVLPNKVKLGDKITEVLIKGEDHARRWIHLVDSKYGIDGYFIADPTWDNDLENDLYNHALLNIDEYVGINRYNYLSFTTKELFFCKTLEEFYTKINFLLDKEKNKLFKTMEKEVDIIYLLLNDLKDLDNEFYLQILNKYPSIANRERNLSKEVIQDVFLDLGEHIISKVNTIVSGLTFKEAITSLYQDVYGYEGEELNRRVKETMERNKQRQILSFPKRYKIDKDGNRLAILNAVNKFDLDDDEMKLT